MSRNISPLPFLLLSALALAAAPAWGGPLATAPGVYFDGSTTWHGATPFQGYLDPVNNVGPTNLFGTIDWAVWAPDTFPAFSGYTPTPGEFVYAYQINVVGADPVSQSIVLTINQADNIGEFFGDAGFGDITGVAATDLTLVPLDSAQWSWQPSIPAGSTTLGLVFSSLYGPAPTLNVVIDGGSIAFAEVPGPNGPIIPEPGSIALASCGAGMLALYWMRRRTRGAPR